MELRDNNGELMLPWAEPEEAWNAFAALTRRRLCDAGPARATPADVHKPRRA